MRAGLSIHTCPTSPAAHGAASARCTCRIAPHGGPMSPSAGVNSPPEVPATQLPVSVSPYVLKTSGVPAHPPDALPQGGGQRRGAAVHPAERAAARGAGDPERQAPHRGYRGEEADPVRVDDRAQAEQQIGPEGRRDEEVLAGKPGEEAAADEPVAEVSWQEAERAGVGREAELAPQRAPAGGQRGVS